MKADKEEEEEEENEESSSENEEDNENYEDDKEEEVEDDDDLDSLKGCVRPWYVSALPDRSPQSGKEHLEELRISESESGEIPLLKKWFIFVRFVGNRMAEPLFLAG